MNGDLKDFSKSSSNSPSIASIGLQLLDGFSWIHQQVFYLLIQNQISLR
jgi:hypothetical protein